MRKVLLVKRQQMFGMEYLTEISTTENGKVYIVIFKRILDQTTGDQSID